MCSSSSFVQRFKSGRGSSSQSIMQSQELRPSAAGPPLRLSSGWDVLSVLESRISSSHLNQKHYTESMTCTESGASDGFTMIRGPNTDLWLELWESKKDWMIFYFFYKGDQCEGGEQERRDTPGESSLGARLAGRLTTVTEGTLGRVVKKFPAEEKTRSERQFLKVQHRNFNTSLVIYLSVCST